MKPSKYNYYQPYDGGMIFMNGITEASFWVDSSKAEIYKTVIENPDDNYDEFKPFIERLKIQGFIVDSNVDEFSLVKEKYEILRGNDEYRIMILPTYACNLRCWYCVQDHKNEWLQAEDYESIAELILKNISNDNIKSLALIWFGGEPLMAYDQVLQFTERIKALAESMSKDFFCSITSNGTLLNEKRIDELRHAGVKMYQITIDGCKADHDNVKQLGNSSAYERTMANIALIAKHTYCTLRYNYSPATLKPDLIMDDIFAHIPQAVRHNVHFNLQPVWQETFDDTDFKKVVSIMNTAVKGGISASHKTGGLCYVDKAHYDCIYPSGEIGKCENGLKEMRNGKLLPHGKIDMTNADTLHYIYNPVIEDSDCKNCIYLPLCWGPCSQQRYISLRDYGCIKCSLSNKDASIGEQIRNMYISNRCKINSSVNK